MEFMNVCVFCKKTLSDGKLVNVGAKGLQTILLASKKKGDHISEEIMDKTSITVHEICRKNYTRADYVKKTTEKPTDKIQEQTLRSSFKSFDFQNNCLVCGKEICIEKENKKPKQYRKDIRNVTEIRMKEKLVEICNQRDDDLGKQILVRLSNIIDLVAAEGKYHLSCYKNLTRGVPSCSKSQDSQQKCSEKQKAFFKLCEYMESSNECQFSLQHLSQKYEEFCETQETYTPTG